jgi:hypothetical protein
MKKSLVKYILKNVKEDVFFEERLADVFSHKLAPEVSLECLCYGVPAAVEVTDNEALLKACYEKYSDPSNLQVTSITKVELTDDFKIRVCYKYMIQRWFASEVDANTAIARENRYEGVSKKDETHPFKAWIPNLNEDWTFDIEDLEDCVKVTRK